MKRLFKPLGLLALLGAVVLLSFGCSPKKEYSQTTQELVDMVEGDTLFKRLLVQSIDQARAINPDKATNPAQSLDEYYDFVEWSTKAMPWNIARPESTAKLYERIDQSLNYFYFICDQPLDELKGKGYYYNSVQYMEPYRTWLVNYAKRWGEYLSTPESWNDQYYQIAMADDRFGLDKGWYEDKSNWKSFNDFFARYLSSPDARPIADKDDNNVIVAPADSKPQGVWNIDDSSYIVHKDGTTGVGIKSKEFASVAQLLGPQSQYCNAFAGGTLTHTFLDVNDYHRYHFPLSGTIKELIHIQADDAAGGITTWDPASGRYILHCDTPGWQSVETRGLIVLENDAHGLVALMPIGMSQVSSVNFEHNLKVGDKVDKGDMLGYFLFGGSDFVIIFQKGVPFEITAPVKEHIFMGEKYGVINQK